jgi:hypothetical protein
MLAGPELTPNHNLTYRLPMANSPSDAGDPMAREVERLLAQLDRKHPPSPPSKVTPAVAEDRPVSTPASIVWATTPASPTAALAPVASNVESPNYELAALWGRLLLGTSLGILMTDWPYAHGCGWGLLGYGAAVMMILITGAWIALEAWKQRSGLAHVLALVLFYWGLVLAAEQLLPRIGYAWNDAGWQCSASHPAPR